MHALPWALVGLALAPWSGLSVSAAAMTLAAVLCRAALLRQVALAFRLPPQPYRLVPARDLMSFAVFAASFLGRNVRWRGQRYRLFSGKIKGVSE